jgi:hypothetical protein
VVLELGERFALLLARDQGPVLEGLAEAGIVPHECMLLADELGLFQYFFLVLVRDAVVGIVKAFLLESLFFLFQRGELGVDVRVDKVVDILPVEDLRY